MTQWKWLLVCLFMPLFGSIILTGLATNWVLLKLEQLTHLTFHYVMANSYKSDACDLADSCVSLWPREAPFLLASPSPCPPPFVLKHSKAIGDWGYILHLSTQGPFLAEIQLAAWQNMQLEVLTPFQGYQMQVNSVYQILLASGYCASVMKKVARCKARCVSCSC